MDALQAKLTINEPGDKYELEADRVSEQVMRMEAPDVAHPAPPSIQPLGTGAREDLAAKHLQRLCAGCEEDQETENALQRRAEPTLAPAGSGHAPSQAEAKVGAVSGGQPLTAEQRAFFESRFGADFGAVRVHTGGSADAAARTVGALAYTRGHDIVFRGGEYRPETAAGGRLLAHELTHVVQQGAASSRLSHGPERGDATPHLQRQVPQQQQIYPGDGLKPPGDCPKALYIAVRAPVSIGKAALIALGGCSKTDIANPDSCPLLALKISVLSSLIAARIVEMVTCFRGGNRGHHIELGNDMTALDTCYAKMAESNCENKLKDGAREIVEQIAKVVKIVLIVALAIIAVILLFDLIVAFLAMLVGLLAGLAAFFGEAVMAAMMLLLSEILTERPPGEFPTGLKG